MSKSPAFQFYVNDWLGSANIMLMTPAEEGAYIRLLAIAWGSEDCGLPDDEKELAVLSRLGEGWFNGASCKIRKCFIQKGNRIYNKRLLEERKKQEIWKEKSRQGGIKSGRVRSNSKLEPERWLNDPLSGPVEPNGNSSFASSSSFSNKEKKYIKKRKVLIPDEEWLKEIQSQQCYSHLNVKEQLQKCLSYFEVKGKTVSRARFLNWLNSPINQKPLEGGTLNSIISDKNELSPQWIKEAVKQGWKI